MPITEPALENGNVDLWTPVSGDNEPLSIKLLLVCSLLLSVFTPAMLHSRNSVPAGSERLADDYGTG